MFVQYIVGCLAKLGLTPSATADTRVLTVELVELIHKWEQRRIREEYDTMDIDVQGDGPVVTKKKLETALDLPRKRQASSGSVIHYTPSTSVREMIMNYLLRFLCTINEPLHRKGLAPRVVELIRGFYKSELWPDVSIRASVLERFFNVADLKEPTTAKSKDASAKTKDTGNNTNATSILAALAIIAEHNDGEWFIANLQPLQVCVEKCT
jgi:transformation/transcription domain-associated protein